jgi:hypothetical protein
MTRGRTPIEKNVIVVDERGNEYEATYPKRAKGLVKNGRARFIGDSKICLLARPPNLYLEDDSMSEHTYTNSQNPQPEGQKASAGMAEYSVAGILTRIDKIISDTEHIYKALDSISEIMTSGGFDNGAANKAESIATVVRFREKTNQELIHLLERMYDNLVPQQMPEDVVKFQAIIASLKSLESIDADTLAEMVETIIHQMFVELPTVKPGAYRYNNNNGNWNGWKDAQSQPQTNVNVNHKPPRGPKPPKGPGSAYASYAASGNPFDMAGMLRNIADQMSGFSSAHVSTSGDVKDNDEDEEENE